jgi:Icc-related predicted phosphoesterase
MRLRIFSDLHFEFHRDGGRSLVASFGDVPCDAVVLAGDLSNAARLGTSLDILCSQFRDVPVVYVHGNHEFYGSSRDTVLEITAAAVRRNPNLQWLDGSAFEFGGVRFLGAPLWFPHPGPGESLKRLMNDFSEIEGFEQWVYAENARHVDFFERELGTNAVAVSHYLPGLFSVAPQFVGHPLNPFFVCDLEPLIRRTQPALWVHGHTHASIETQVGNTRVVCNPFGYARIEENSSFSTDTVTVIAVPKDH